MLMRNRSSSPRTTTDFSNICPAVWNTKKQTRRFAEFLKAEMRHLSGERCVTTFLDNMANPEHLKILKQGTEAWYQWREKNQYTRPDFMRANLSNFNLKSPDFQSAYLHGANLHGANLIGSDIRCAILRDADLSNANLSNANLPHVELSNAKLTGTILTGAKFGNTIIGNVDFSAAIGLETVIHYSPSTIGIDTLYKSHGNIPDDFLRGAGVPEEIIDIARSIRCRRAL